MWRTLVVLVAVAVVVDPPQLAAAQSEVAAVDCHMLQRGPQLQQLSVELNSECCNNGSGESGGGHRRQLQQRRMQTTSSNAEFCQLGVCTAACAEIFVPLFEQCPAQMQSMLNGVDGVYRFLGNCYETRDAAPGVVTTMPPPPAAAEVIKVWSETCTGCCVWPPYHVRVLRLGPRRWW